MRAGWTTLFVFALLLCTTVACRSSQEATRKPSSSLQKVELGMSPADVRAVMGKPYRTIRENGAVQWMMYGTPAHRLMIYFQNERVMAVPRSAEDRAYSDIQ